MIDIVNLASPDKAQKRCELTTSEQYSFIPTEEISEALLSKGWGVSKIITTKPRTQARIGYQKHMVRYRRMGEELKIGQRHLELLLVNAHDGTTSYQFKGGIFELVCSNGLIVSSREFPGVRVNHKDTAMPSIIDASMEVAERLPMLAHQVKMMEAIGMTPNQREEFALRAIDIRYGVDSKIPAEIMLKPRREEDTPTTLWKTLNVVQENIMLGGMYAPHRAGGWQPLKAVKGMEMNLRVNEELWGLAAEQLK